jgi:hypothetical protein
MGYRSHNRRRRRRRDDRDDDGILVVILSDLFGLIARGILALLLGLWRLLRFGWTSAFRRSAPPQPVWPVLQVAPAVQGVVSESRNQPPPPPLVYRRCNHLLSPGERAFCHHLYQAVKGRYRIFCKVRLGDVIEAGVERGDRWNERRLFRKIKGYHVDFVLTDPETTEPLLVIELDDRSHGWSRQGRTDRFKDDVLKIAGMPIYRVRCRPAYDPISLAGDIERLIANRAGDAGGGAGKLPRGEM